MIRYILLSLMVIPSTFTSFTSVPSIQLLKTRPFVSIHKEPLVVMNAINKNKSKIIKVKFDDDLRDFDDKLLKFNIIYFTYLICLYWYIISVFKQ
jgi:hypothetical protein